MNIYERLAVWMFGKHNQTDVEYGERVYIKQFDPNAPFIDQGFRTQVNNPNSLSDIIVTQVIVLSCGHTLSDPRKIVQCYCLRAHCPSCAEKVLSHCHRCSAAIAPCCRHHSISSGRDYCPEHWRWYYWLLGK